MKESSGDGAEMGERCSRRKIQINSKFFVKLRSLNNFQLRLIYFFRNSSVRFNEWKLRLIDVHPYTYSHTAGS